MSLRYRLLPPQTRLLVTGPDRKRFLHGMLTNDIIQLKTGTGCHAVLLSAKGKMQTDLVVYDQGEALLLVMPGHVREKVVDIFHRHLIMDDAHLIDVSAEIGQIGVYGEDIDFLSQTLSTLPLIPSAQSHLSIAHSLSFLLKDLNIYQFISLQLSNAALSTDISPYIHIAKTNDIGIPGYHLFAPAFILEKLQATFSQYGISELSEQEATLFRVEAGIPLYGVDMDEDRLPLEANLDHAMSFSKGCYLGQEVIVRVTSRGHINRKLMGLHLPEAESLPMLGTNLMHETKENAGTIMSAVNSPRFGKIALAYVHRNFWEVGTRLYMGERGNIIPENQQVAVVCNLPF